MKKWICVILAAACLLLTGCDSKDYKTATELYGAGEYAAAAQAFRTLGDYKDSAAMVTACEYALAQQLLAAGDWADAQKAFEALGSYADSAEQALRCRYEQAKTLMEGGVYPEAEKAFESLGDYADSAQLALQCRYEQAVALLEADDYAGALALFASLGDYGDSATLLQQAQWLQLQRFLIEQPPYMTEDGYNVGITAIDPDQLTLWVEKIMDLGFYVVVDRCAISFALGADEGRYELQSQTQTMADGLTGRTSSTADGTILLAELMPDTQLPLTNFYYHGQDVYGNITERTEPWLGEREKFAEIRGMLSVLFEHIPVLLEQSGTGYTLQSFGLTGAE